MDNHERTCEEFRAGKMSQTARQRAEMFRRAAAGIREQQTPPELVARMLEHWADVQDAIADSQERTLFGGRWSCPKHAARALGDGIRCDDCGSPPAPEPRPR